MKKILLSLLTIGAVSASAFGASRAFFSDTEKSLGNTITTGTIDISVDTHNPWSEPITITDMKPSYVRWTKHVVKNVGENPLRLWKHITNIQTDNSGWSEPECSDAGGTYNNGDCTLTEGVPTEKNDIDTAIVYDIYLNGNVDGDEDHNWLGGHHTEGTPIITEADGKTLHDMNSVYVFLGTLEPNTELTVWQSYHMKDDTGNWAQTDNVTFDMEFYAEQVNGTGPIGGGPSGNGPYTLLLENKDTSWSPILNDGRWGILRWQGDGDNFDFTLEAHGLAASTDYDLIYYADGWPGNHPGAFIDTAKSDPSGNLSMHNTPDLKTDIPSSPDANYPTGGKVWLVKSADYNSGTHTTGSMTAWHMPDYLFEYNLIKYTDPSH